MRPRVFDFLRKKSSARKLLTFVSWNFVKLAEKLKTRGTPRRPQFVEFKQINIDTEYSTDPGTKNLIATFSLKKEHPNIHSSSTEPIKRDRIGNGTETAHRYAVAAPGLFFSSYVICLVKFRFFISRSERATFIRNLNELACAWIFSFLSANCILIYTVLFWRFFFFFFAGVYKLSKVAWR